MFTHLHVHTEYSLLDGLCRIPILVQRAKELGMEALAITDHGALYGWLQFYLQAKEAGIKPILGCEVYLALQNRHSKKGAERNPYHLILLAKNRTGYHNLLKLSTRGFLEGFYYKPRVDKELLEQHHEGLIALSGCPQGELGRLILEGRVKEAEKAALWYKEVFGDFYLELQQHDIPELERINQELIRIGHEYGIPLVATNDVHYVNQSDAPVHDLLLCIQTNSTVYDEKRPRMADDSFYLKTPQEMAELFEDLPEALENTERIAEMCELELELGQFYFPEVELPQGQTADEYLAELCWKNLPSRYPEVTPEIEERLRYELDVIRQMHFANYFLVVYDVISFARSQGILFGVRGSAAASVVLYCLGVTDIDPLAHNLIFERFLNLERREMPDIDLDFEDDRRDEVLRYVAQKYGSDRVAQIITFGTMGARAAIRDVGRALGMPYGQVDQVARLVPQLGTDLRTALEEVPQLQQLYREDEEIRRLLDFAIQLEGVARHASTHAAGVVISDRPLVEVVPLQNPTGGGEGLNTTQFAMDDLAALGMLKMDFLGLANLTILKKARELISEVHGTEIDLDHLPLDDKRTFELLSSGETIGVFQLEGSGMRRYIKELKPESFSDLAAMVALYRPGPKQQLPNFIAAKQGRMPIRFPHPGLEEILRETYGVIVYQEQVLLITQKFAGYTLGEADLVRKAMGKKIPEIMERERSRFIEGAKKKGYPEDVAQQVYELIEPFAGYAFNKAHAVSYAMLAYRTAYLKANYPVEFMAALLTVNLEKQEKVASAVAECRRLGIKVLPPDINRSRETFTVERGDEGEFCIRFGLGAIKNVGSSAIRPLLAARDEGGPFKSVEDLCRRADLRGIGKKALESLVKAGALDSLEARGKLLGSLDRILKLSHQEQQLRESGQLNMFNLFGESTTSPLPSLELEEIPVSPREMQAWEKELLGVYLFNHPLSQAASRLSTEVTALCGEIGEEMVGQEVTLAGMVTSLRQGRTRAGRPFVSAVLEDLVGSVEVVAWPEVYQETAELWKEGNILLLSGKVEVRRGQVQLTCRAASLYQPALEEARPHQLLIRLEQTNDVQADITRLKQLVSLLQQFPGKDEVILRIPDGEATLRLQMPNLSVNYCSELQQRLSELVGRDNLEVR